MIEDFRGEFYHHLDNKNRLSIPRKFLSRLMEEEKGNVKMTRGLDRCIWVYPASNFDIVEKRMLKLDMFDPDVQNFQNAYFTTARDEVIDKAGRILIPKFLVDHAQIDKEVVIVGGLIRLQIWSLDNWNKKVEEMTFHANDMAKLMSGKMGPMSQTESGSNDNSIK
jgi:MraZ protein